MLKPIATITVLVILISLLAVNSATGSNVFAESAPLSDGTLADDPKPFGPSGTWNLIFNDEFNNNSLDLKTWEPSWFGGIGISNPVNTDEDGCYDSTQVSVSGGTLNLTAESTSNSSCRKRDGSRADYVSGLVNTRNGFLFAYGYMEARMYLPGSNGDIYNWPTFWTDGTGDWPSTGEIDVMESLSGHQPCWHYHYLDSSGKHQGPGGCVNWSDPTGWHMYGAKWEPGRITFYYDGQEVGTHTDGVVDAEHFIILNNGINDRYGINVPATVKVDYVRVWKEGSGPLPPSGEPTTQPVTLPGRIEAEDYRAGGEGVGYHDTSSGNAGGEYRNDDVDIELAADGAGEYNVGWIDASEWLVYDIDVAQTESYDITARVSSARSGTKTLHMEVDGSDVTGPISFTDSSGWQSWIDVSVPGVPLQVGTHELRIVMDASGFNVNYIDVVTASPQTNQPPTVNAGPDGEATLASPVTVDLFGNAIDDGLPTGVLTTQWTASGLGPVTFGDEFSASTKVTFIEAGEYVLRLTASDGEDSAYDEMTITVKPDPATMHVHDLDAQGVKLNRGYWKALVTITLNYANHNPLINATVTGTFTQDGSMLSVRSCNTDANGECTVDSGQFPHKKKGSQFIVDDVFHASLTYEPLENHDPDGDSDGSVINLSK